MSDELLLNTMLQHRVGSLTGDYIRVEHAVRIAEEWHTERLRLLNEQARFGVMDELEGIVRTGKTPADRLRLMAEENAWLRTRVAEAEAAVAQYEEVVAALDVLSQDGNKGVVWPIAPRSGE